ncbi:hypothetical protein F4814DRAFT_452136 [Daldinia grandis]|nr:hypothetical protein F4814DRAFT_452136 [Daldinia grandis]
MAGMTPEFDMSSQRPSQLPPCPGPPPSRPLPPLPKTVDDPRSTKRIQKASIEAAVKDRIEATRTTQAIAIGQCAVGEEFLGFRSLPFCPFPALDFHHTKVHSGMQVIASGALHFYARLENSLLLSAPLALLQHRSFAGTCTNPASIFNERRTAESSMPP